MRLASNVKILHLVLHHTLEMMVPLESLDPKDHLMIIKAVMEQSEIVNDSHHIYCT